jgi:GAF domain-containing protein
LAREHGFVQNEGLTHELAAQCCLARSLGAAGYAYLRNARNCYDPWGALGKVKQLDERYPGLHEKRDRTSPMATIGTSVGLLDVETVVKDSQALSSEIVLPRLIEKLIEAEAITGHRGVEVAVRQAALTPSDLPQSAFHYVFRTGERVVLDDASLSNL